MFKKLKTEMFAQDIDQKYLCEKLGKSQTYITQRMTGKKPWTMADVYIICDLLKIPYANIAVFFPNGGRV